MSRAGTDAPPRPAVRRGPLLSAAQGAIGWGTLGLILLAALVNGGNDAAIWTPMALAAAILFALQLCLAGWRGTPAQAARLWGPGLLFVAALGWGVAQTLPHAPPALAHPFWTLVPGAEARISAAPVAGHHAVLRLAAYAMVFWIAVHAALNPGRARAFLAAIAVVSSLVAAYGLALAAPTGAAVSATFVNRNAYASFAIIGLLANLGMWIDCAGARMPGVWSRRHALRRAVEGFLRGGWVFVLGAALCLSALLLSGSRAGAGAGLIAAGTLALLCRAQMRNALSAWLPALALFAALAAMLAGTILERGPAEAERFLVYRAMLENIEARLLLGHGLGAFQDTFRPHLPAEVAVAEWSRAHNSYLENLWELGLPAALALYAALSSVAAGLLRGALDPRRRRVFCAVAAACIVGLGLHAAIDFALQMPATAALFAFVLGIGWAHARPAAPPIIGR